MKLKLISIIISAALLIIPCGCAQNEKPESVSFQAMDTFMKLDVYGDNSAAEKIKNQITKLDSLLSPTDEKSDIFMLNRDKKATADELTAELTKKSLEICEQTVGALDVTIYPIVREWGFISGKYKIPDKSVLSGLLKKVSYKNATVSGNEITLKNGAELDLGATAKGFAADKAVEILKSSGSESAILNLGGTIAAYGKKPDGSLWRVGIADPKNTAEYIGYVQCSDKIVATSGSYERYFKGSDGKIYSHIIDPRDGYPVDNGIKSVTIVSENGLKSDCLSTALFVMGKDKAVDYLRKNKNFEYVILTDNEAFVSEGLKDSFTLSSAGYAVRVIEKDD